MGYWRGSGSRLEGGGRAAAGVGVALALVLLRGGTALADYPPHPAFPAGSDLASRFAGSEPAAAMTPIPSRSPGAGRTATPTPTAAGASHSSLLAGLIADPAALVWELLWLFGFVPGLLTPGQPCPVCGAPPSPVPTGPRGSVSPAASPGAARPPGPTATAAASPAVSAVPAPESVVAPSPAAATVPGPTSSGGQPGSSLASTGTPVVAALAGVVLLAVGGYLTWSRERSSE